MSAKLTQIDKELEAAILKTQINSKINTDIIVIVFKRPNFIHVGNFSIILKKTANTQTLKNRLLRLKKTKRLIEIEKQGTESVWKVQLNQIPKRRKENFPKQLTIFTI